MTDKDVGEVVAWRYCEHDINGDPWPWKYTEAMPHRDYSEVEPLVRLSDYQALKAERDAAIEAEDEAKDCFWAVYPTYVVVKGHGISTEAARSELAARAESAEARQAQLLEALREVVTVRDRAAFARARTLIKEMEGNDPR